MIFSGSQFSRMDGKPTIFCRYFRHFKLYKYACTVKLCLDVEANLEDEEQKMRELELNSIQEAANLNAAHLEDTKAELSTENEAKVAEEGLEKKNMPIKNAETEIGKDLTDAGEKSIKPEQKASNAPAFSPAFNDETAKESSNPAKSPAKDENQPSVISANLSSSLKEKIEASQVGGLDALDKGCD
eukprot:Sdes_comp19969_c0_seq2m12528